MAIEFICPACQGTLSMPDDSAGRLVRCGNCLTTLSVPEAASQAPAQPAYEEVKPPRPKKVEPVHDDRDEHGEPRPRRSRKRKGGRSPLFWIIIILLALGLFTCLACGGGILILATPRWEKVDSQAGGFTVEFPAKTNPNIARDANLQLKPNEFVEGAPLVGRVEFFWVWYTAFDGRWKKFADEEKVIDEVLKQLTKDGKGDVISKKAKKVDGHSAVEAVIAQPEGQIYHCLVVLGNSKLYIVAAGGPFVDADGNPRIRHYLDSFHVK